MYEFHGRLCSVCRVRKGSLRGKMWNVNGTFAVTFTSCQFYAGNWWPVHFQTSVLWANRTNGVKTGLSWLRWIRHSPMYPISHCTTPDHVTWLIHILVNQHYYISHILFCMLCQPLVVSLHSDHVCVALTPLCITLRFKIHCLFFFFLSLLYTFICTCIHLFYYSVMLVSKILIKKKD